MKRFLILSCASLALGACGDRAAENSVIAEEQPVNAYAEYENDRYGYLIAYPADKFTPQERPQNNDGRVFDGPEGSTLRVFGTNNALGLSFEEQVARAGDALSEILTEENTGTRWYAEGYDHDGNWVSIKLIHDGPERLMTARFTADDGSDGELRETGRMVVRSLQLDGGAVG